MSKKNNLIDKVNKLYQEGLELKESAIKPQADTNLFKQAAEKYKAASLVLEKIINTEKEYDDKIRSEVLMHYYLHEEADCLYALNLKNDDLKTAQVQVDNALKEINEAVTLIDNNLENVGESTKQFLLEMKGEWDYRKLVTEAKSNEPKAKLKSRSSDFIGSFDIYNTMLDKYSKAKEYCVSKNLSPQLKRISLGNYFGLSVNVSQMLAGHMNSLNKQGFDLNIDLLKHFLDSYDLSKKAFESNPEWTEYREGQDVMRKNIIKILSSNKTKWNDFLIEFGDNVELEKVMKTIDMETYKNIKAKSEIESNSFKNLYFTGIFWLIVLLIIGFTVFSIFDSSIPILYKPLAVFLIIVLFTVIGAFILKSTQKLSEAGFLELMKLSLKVGFKGINSLDRKEGKKAI